MTCLIRLIVYSTLFTTFEENRCETSSVRQVVPPELEMDEGSFAWMGQLRLVTTNGVNTNGAAAEVINFDRLGKVRAGTFGKIKMREYPKRSLVKKTEKLAVTPFVLTPGVPLRSARRQPSPAPQRRERGALQEDQGGVPVDGGYLR